MRDEPLASRALPTLHLVAGPPLMAALRSLTDTDRAEVEADLKACLTLRDKFTSAQRRTPDHSTLPLQLAALERWIRRYRKELA